MNLIDSPIGALLERPWLDAVGRFTLPQFMRVSRLWAAANVAAGDVGRFRAEAGLPTAGSSFRLRRLLARHHRLQQAADAARQAWETAIFDAGAGSDAGLLDDRRRRAAERHQKMRGAFSVAALRHRPARARWQIDPPPGNPETTPAALYRAPIDAGSLEVSRSFVRDGLKEYWLRAPTPSPRLAARRGSETLYARVVEAADGAGGETLIFGGGLCMEFDQSMSGRDPSRRLAARGWRVIEVVSPYHGLRTMPGYFGGEPYLALTVSGTLDLLVGQALDTALLTAFARRRFGGTVSVSGISMGAYVAQQVAGHCHLWPAEAQPDAAMLISHSGRLENALYFGELASLFGVDRAVREAGWTRETLTPVARAIDPPDTPALAPSRIVSVLGETDRWVPYEDGLAFVRQWRLPEANIFRYRVGHLGMPVKLTRDPAAFERLRQVSRGR
jgi:hypothetical protein